MVYFASIMATSRSRTRLTKVLRHSTGVVTLDDICKSLGVARVDASKIAARWVHQGKLIRIRRGLFAPVPPDSEPETSSVADPWQLVPELFGTAYVTGWSAAELWHLTEQIFRRICVRTANAVRHNIVSVRDAEFFVTHVPEDSIFGTRTRWAGRVRVPVADPHRTIVDMLDDPRLAGGGRHLADCLASYFASEHASEDTIIAYADRVASGAIFKRLGFLAEGIPGSSLALLEKVRRRLTPGYALLDPAIKSGRIITRWRLRVPEQFARDRES